MELVALVNRIFQVPATLADVLDLVTYTTIFLSPLPGSIKLDKYTLPKPFMTKVPLFENTLTAVPSGAVTTAAISEASLAYAEN